MALTRVDSYLVDLDAIGGITFDDQGGVPTLKVDAATHRVGIGTADPQYNLDIAGDLRVTGVITSSGGINAPLYIDESEDDNIFYNVPFLDTTGGGNTYRLIQVDSGGLEFNPGTNSLAVNNVEPSSVTGRLQLLSGDSTPVLIIASNKFVGIGTTAPTSLLEVAGDVTIADKIIHRGDTNTSIRFPEADAFTIETAGAERLRITSAGNVGIGTTNPVEKLDVRGNIYISSGNYLSLGSTDGTENFILRGYGGSGWVPGITYTPSSSTGNRGYKIGAFDNAGTFMPWLSIWDGNVGIGVTNPSATLHVNGSSIIGSSTAVMNPDNFPSTVFSGLIINGGWGATGIGGNMGVGDSWALAHNGSALFLGMGDGTTNNTMASIMQWVPDGSHIFYSRGSQVATISSTGNVGIGTTNPQHKLDVDGVTRSNIFVSTSFASFGSIVATDPGSNYFNWNNRIGGGLAAVGTVYVDGNLGIGTDAPRAKLHVSGPGNTSGGNIIIGSVSETTPKWSFITSTHYNSISQPQGFALIGGFTTDTANSVIIGGGIYETNPCTDIQFWTHTSTTHNLGGSEKVRITSNGNVGIGTGNPLAKLDVLGQAMFQGSISSSIRGTQVGVININNNAADGIVDFTQGIVFTDNNGNQGTWTHAGIVSTGSTNYNGSLVFGTDGDSLKNTTGIVERMRITSSGNVGIGTTNPQNKVHILGETRIQSINSNYGSVIKSIARTFVDLSTTYVSFGESITTGGNSGFAMISIETSTDHQATFMMTTGRQQAVTHRYTFYSPSNCTITENTEGTVDIVVSGDSRTYTLQFSTGSLGTSPQIKCSAATTGNTEVGILFFHFPHI